MDICAKRHLGHQLSFEAFNAVKGKSGLLKNAIVDFLKKEKFGATVEEISSSLNLRLTTVSARCAELKRDNKIYEHGTRPTSSGRKASVLFSKTL